VREGVCCELRHVIGITDSAMCEVLLCIQLNKAHVEAILTPQYFGVRRLLLNSDLVFLQQSPSSRR
jgi:hypothetical protein